MNFYKIILVLQLLVWTYILLLSFRLCHYIKYIYEHIYLLICMTIIIIENIGFFNICQIFVEVFIFNKLN
jgi:hypothetical protein